jgi:hypothetical protein
MILNGELDDYILIEWLSHYESSLIPYEYKRFSKIDDKNLDLSEFVRSFWENIQMKYCNFNFNKRKLENDNDAEEVYLQNNLSKKTKPNSISRVNQSDEEDVYLKNNPSKKTKRVYDSNEELSNFDEDYKRPRFF